MHRPLVTLPIIALLFFLSGCSGMGGFGGMTASGGRPTPSSVLLGVALPAGTEYFPSHSSISGQDGVEILRSSSGPAVCAGTIASGLQARGWKVRLSQTSGNRGFYIFENGGRLAIVHVSIQTPPMQTLVQIAAGTQLRHSHPAGHESAYGNALFRHGRHRLRAERAGSLIHLRTLPGRKPHSGA